MSTANLPATTPSAADARLSTWVKRPDVYNQIAAAVGPLMPADQFIAHAMVSFQQPGKTGRRGYEPGPRDCSPASKLKCLYEMAAMVLLPTLGQVALIARNSDDSDDGPQLSCMPQWQGYKAIMERHPAVLQVTAKLVHIGDVFDYDADTGIVTRHTFDPFDPERIIKPETIKGGYLKVTYRDGRPPLYHIVKVAQIEKARKCAQQQYIWNDWYEEMALKTIYRNAYGRRVVPVDPMVAHRLEKLTAADDALLGNDPSRVALPAPEAAEPPLKTGMDRLPVSFTPPSTTGTATPVGFVDHVGDLPDLPPDLPDDAPPISDATINEPPTGSFPWDDATDEERCTYIMDKIKAASGNVKETRRLFREAESREDLSAASKAAIRQAAINAEPPTHNTSTSGQSEPIPEAKQPPAQSVADPLADYRVALAACTTNEALENFDTHILGGLPDAIKPGVKQLRINATESIVSLTKFKTKYTDTAKLVNARIKEIRAKRQN